MSLFNRLISSVLPVVPRSIVGRVSRRYIAGSTLEDAMRVVSELNREGAMATLDVLGEDTLERAQAGETVRQYELAIAEIARLGLDCNVSIKLTALGLMIDRSFCRDNLFRVLELAKPHGMFVRIDMEDSSTTATTLDIYREARANHDNVGPVLQAYLRRSLADARSLLDGPPLNVRLCKGIYNEPPEVAFKDRDVVRRSYSNLLEILVRGGAYVGIATHDEPLLYEGLRVADALGLKRDQYEFQMLLGVIPATRRTLISAGHRLRVYVPYGANWYGYSIRRLKENPTIARHVMKSMFRGER